jgi:hypothetical protein
LLRTLLRARSPLSRRRLAAVARARATRSDIKDGFPGELRVQLCRVKTSAMNAGGTVPVANAGAPRARRRTTSAVGSAAVTSTAAAAAALTPRRRRAPPWRRRALRVRTHAPPRRPGAAARARQARV